MLVKVVIGYLEDVLNRIILTELYNVTKLLQNDYWKLSNGCSWYPNTYAYAPENGYLKVLQWARFKGCRGTSPSGDKVFGIWI